MASAIAAFSTGQASEQELLLSKNPKYPTEVFIIRPVRLFDIPKLAIRCHEVYLHTPAFKFLLPLAEMYPSDSIRFFRKWITHSYLRPHSICLVLCPASDPSTPIAHIQFNRLGNDAGAKKLVRDRGLWNKILLWIVGWYFVAYNWLENAIWPDRVFDMERAILKHMWHLKDEERYWEYSEERRNRWHVMNIVVDTQWQAKGLGKLLMREVMARAQREMVVVGLEATSKGEKLYRSLGFEMLGDYHERLKGDDNGGGIMVWYPEGWTACKFL